MTMTIASGARRPARACDTHRVQSRTRLLSLDAAPSLGKLAAAVLARPGRAQREPRSAGIPLLAGGAIGGAVISAARRSAVLSRSSLARRLGVTPATVRSWETGSLPLYRVSYHQLRQVAEALGAAGTTLDELLLVSQCDLLIAGMLGGFEDYAEVPPLDDREAGSDAARGLLRWALTGDVPDRYRRHARRGPLLASRDVTAFAALARDLASGSSGPELANYGAALLALVGRPSPSRKGSA